MRANRVSRARICDASCARVSQNGNGFFRRARAQIFSASSQCAFTHTCAARCRTRPLAARRTPLPSPVWRAANRIAKKPSPRHYWPRAIFRAARCVRARVFLVMKWRRFGVVEGAVRRAQRRRKRGAMQKKITWSASKIRVMRSMRDVLRSSSRKYSRKNSSYQLRIDKVIVYLTTLKLSICESENKFSAQRQKTQSIRDANSHRYAETFDPDIEPPSLN